MWQLYSDPEQQAVGDWFGTEVNYMRTDPWSPQLCARQNVPAGVDLEPKLNCGLSELRRQRLELQATESAGICRAGYQRRRRITERQTPAVCKWMDWGSVAENWAAQIEGKNPEGCKSHMLQDRELNKEATSPAVLSGDTLRIHLRPQESYTLRLSTRT